MDARYVTYWKDWKSGPPAIDPRAAHHRQFVPDAEFVMLCQDAERVDARVHLIVGKPYGPEGKTRSDLTSIQIPERVVVAFGSGDSIRSVAARARERLAAA